MNIKPNPAFLISTPEGEPTFYAAAHAERARLEAVADAVEVIHLSHSKRAEPAHAVKAVTTIETTATSVRAITRPTSRS